MKKSPSSKLTFPLLTLVINSHELSALPSFTQESILSAFLRRKAAAIKEDKFENVVFVLCKGESAMAVQVEERMDGEFDVSGKVPWDIKFMWKYSGTFKEASKLT